MNLYPVINQGNLAYIDDRGKIIIHTCFSRGWNFSEDRAAVCTADGKVGFIDNTGSIIIDTQFENAGLFSEGYCKVMSNGKWGLIDRKGEWTLRPLYADIGNVKDGLVAIQKETGRNISYINIKGDIIIPDNGAGIIRDFSEGKIVSRNDAKSLFGFRDTNGIWVIEANFSSAAQFSEGLAAVNKIVNNKEITGFIDHKGETRIPFEFNTTLPVFSEGLAIAGKHIKNKILYGAIDKTGKWAIEPQFYYLQGFCSGLCLCRRTSGSLIGFIDCKANMVIFEKFKSGFAFQKNLARVQDENGWIYINKSGECIWRFE